MKAAITVLTTCAFLLAPLPVLAQDAPDDSVAQAQDVELPREVRVLVQRGLAYLGFDPGPADGLFGPKTRAAIWDWQAAKELDTTGYLTLIEAEALAAVGAEASETLDMELEAPAAHEPGGMAAQREPGQLQGSAPKPQVLYFPTCGTDHASPEGCWRALTSPADCVLWWYEGLGVSEIWSGKCDDTLRASGRGTLKTELGDLTWSASGELVEGRRHGNWVERFDQTGREDLTFVCEGPFVGGKKNGHWFCRFATGGALEGRYVDGEFHGLWVNRTADGTTIVKEWRHGELVP